MRFSLPLRIFVVHLVFMVALGVLGLHLVKRAFEDYEKAWDEQLDTFAAEQLFTPLANEVARSLLLRLEQGQLEQQEQIRRTVGEGLDEIPPARLLSPA